MSLTQQDKQDITDIVHTAIAPMKAILFPMQAEVQKQGVLLEASEERGNMALSMLSAQLASELKSKENETRIAYLESGHKVLQAIVKYHEQLLTASQK